MKFLSVLILATAFLNASAQYDDASSVALPSANTNFLKSNSVSGVSLYTGKPNIGVPLYTLPSKEISVPISLGYSATGGIKVQDVANYVGLGWKLNSGGYISRVVRGLPDESTNGYIGTGKTGEKVNGTIDNTLLDNVGKGLWDGEPDVYILSIPSFEMRFVFDQYGKPVFATPQGVKVSHNLYNNSSPQSTSWVVTDDQGNRYYFGSDTSSRETLNTKLFNTTSSFTSTWYLDKIVSNNDRDSVMFSYIKGSDYSYSYYKTLKTVLTTTPSCTVSPNTLQSDNEIIYTYQTPRYVSSITSLLGKVDFSYSFDRSDITNIGKLNAITVRSLNANGSGYNTGFIKQINFSYSYFGSSSDTSLRLKLNDVTVLDSSAFQSIKIASFNYYTSNTLPNRQSIQFDHWGYFNTNTTGTNLPPTANKNPDLNRTKSCILTGIDYPEQKKLFLDYELNEIYDSSTSSNKSFGGLRIKTIQQSDTMGDTTSTKFVYRYNDGKSSGQPYLKNYNYDKNIYVSIVSGSGFCGITGVNTSSENDYESKDLNGVEIGYSYVKTLSDNGGYEVSVFSNFDTAPDAFTNDNSTHQAYGYSSARQLSAATSYAYKRGLLLRKSVYTAQNVLIDSLSNTYTNIDSELGLAKGLRATGYNYIAGSSANAWLYGTYSNIYQNYLLTQTVDRVYDQATPSNFLSTTTNYEYSTYPYKLQKKITAVNSDNISTVKTFYYSQDTSFPNITAPEKTLLQQMVSEKNVLSAPVLIQETNDTTTSSIHFAYTKMTDANARNKYFFTSKYSYSSFEATDKTEAFNYNVNTALMTDKQGLNVAKSSFLYDYNNALLVAICANAASGDISFSSFETGTKGGFTYAASPLTDSSSPTGVRCYRIATNDSIMRSGLTSTKTYTVSYWTKRSSAFNITGTQSGYPVQGKTINGWTYYEHKITGQTVVKLKDTGRIDELRLYPFDAQMKTYCHLPLLGASSVCDENNVVTYYTYDEFGRLKLISDQDRNVVTKYCYNYAGQTAPCDGSVYYNARLILPFTKNNCTSCSTVGSTIYDTVPAGTFYSQNSQLEADQKAQAYLNATGQAYANANGSCVAPPTAGLNGSNQTTSNVSITLTNTCGGATYNYTINASSSGSFGPFPSGTYNVYMSTSGTRTFTINGYSQTATNTVNFYNIVINGGASVNIH